MNFVVPNGKPIVIKKGKVIDQMPESEDEVRIQESINSMMKKGDSSEIRFDIK